MTIDNYEISHKAVYIILVFLISVAMRFFIALLQSLEVRCSEINSSEKIKNMTFQSIYKSFFWGRNPVSGRHDLFYNFALGSIELLIYPILIGTNNIEVVGAWLGFKALAQWGKWNKNRLIYNRFLLANIIIVITGYLLATQFVLIER